MNNKNNLFSTTTRAALIVGTFDISAAFLQYYIKTGKNPKNVLTYIASAVFGKHAFAGGVKMIISGLLLHFLVAYIFTLLFFLAYPMANNLLKNKIIIAVLYGIFMWALMQYIVVPLTSAPRLTVTLTSAIIAILILIICIAIPLSYMAAKFYKKRV